MIYYILIGILGFVFCNILIQPGEIFSFVKPSLAKLFGQKELDLEALNGWRYALGKILTCQNCFSGEFSLWFSLIYFVWYKQEYLWLTYFFGISLSICVAHFLTAFNNSLKVENACKL